MEDAPHMGLKEICRMIYKRVEVTTQKIHLRTLMEKIVVQLLDRNWQLGKYDMKMNELHLDFCWDNLKHDGDHMLYHWQHCGFTLIDRRITPTVQVTLDHRTLQMGGTFDCSAGRGCGENYVHGTIFEMTGIWCRDHGCDHGFRNSQQHHCNGIKVGDKSI